MKSAWPIVAAILVAVLAVGFWLALPLIRRDRSIAVEAKQSCVIANPAQVQQALASSPSDPVALRSMAAQCVLRNDYGGAVKYEQASLRADPHNPYTQFQLAFYLLHEHQKSKADSILQSLASSNGEIGKEAQGLLRKTRGSYTIR